MTQIQAMWSGLLRPVPCATVTSQHRAAHIAQIHRTRLPARTAAALIGLLALHSLAAAQNTTVTLTPAGNPPAPWPWPIGSPFGGVGQALALSGTSNVPLGITGISQVNITMSHSFVGDGRIRLEYTPSTGPGAGVATTAEILAFLGTDPNFPNSSGDSSNLGGTYTFIDPPLGQNTYAILTNSANGTNFVLPSGQYSAVGRFNVPTSLSTSLAGVNGTGTWRLLFDANGGNGTGTISAASVTFTSSGCPGAWSALPAGASTVNAMVSLPGGDVLMGDLGRFNPTTNTWTALPSRTNGVVNTLAVTPAGDVIAGGTFTTAGGVPASNIARYSPSTGLWSALGSGTNGIVNAVVELPGGDLIAGGSFTAAGGISASRIARYNPSTNAWSALGSGLAGGNSAAGPSVNALALLPGGDVVVAGDFFGAGGFAAGALARYNPTTHTWVAPGPGPNVNGTISALAVLPGGDAIAAGGSMNPNFTGGPFMMARGNMTTNTWTGLGVYTSFFVSSLAVLPSGDIIVGGPFAIAGGVPANAIIRCNPDTNVWTALGSGVTRQSPFIPSVFSTLALPSGDVIASGSFTSAGGVAATGIARYAFGNPAPSVSTQPSPQSTCVSGTATFVVAAANTGAVSYQWQWLPEATAAWTNLTNGTNGHQGQALLEVTGAASSMLNAQAVAAPPGDLSFRCIVTSVAGCGNVTSNAATLTVGGPECCPGDFNLDGGIDGADVGAFFEQWEAGNSSADVNADGGIDGADVSTFFEHWEAGC